MKHSITLVTGLPCLLVLLGCAASVRDSDTSHATWNEEVQVHGALRAMFHQGQTGPMVNLNTILPNSQAYAVGAVADLSGEITVIGGKAFLSYPEGKEGSRTEATVQSNIEATLLVATEVSEWHAVTIESPIPFEGLDAAVEDLAISAGMTLDKRFPFLLEGTFEKLEWHVIDGSRLIDGGNTHKDHLAAAVQSKVDSASATLVGFYSNGDQSVFTHMDSKTHVHCVLGSPLASGHVDSVLIPSGTVVKFPVR